MIVCIAEKPSVARDIARIIGANTTHDGYIEGNGYQVTWTYGHLCTLKEPNDYTSMWKSWNLSSLPMIPPRFGIKLIEQDSIKRQFAVIEKLMKQAERIVNCGDAGQEGELIQRWVMQKAGATCPVSRLWISSMTDDAIREGFANLKDQADYQPLYMAGLSRAIGDWLLGMNATRLYTLKYGQNRQVLSIGRVQTPTLALIVNRQKEIENFKPEPYWVLATIYRDTTFTATKGKFTNEEEGKQAFSTIEGKPFTVTSVQKKNGTEQPPQLYDLTSLQVDCNRKFGFSAEMTLNLIQALYERKYTTYPRVDTQYLSDDIYPKCPATLNGLYQTQFAGVAPYTNFIKPIGGKTLKKSKRVFDSAKVTDHHAIIPTNVDPRKVMLTRDEKLVYDLVAKRFIAAFYPDCEFSTTTVMAKISQFEFKATGKQILKEGWRAIYSKDKTANNTEGSDTDDNGNMPEFVVGESGPHEPSLLKKATQPPKMYNEGTLLRAMETAGKFVDDEELRDAMKENGIGRPSTRAAIIETLLRRHYITKERKNLVATTAGCQLIDTIKDELLKSAKLTGLWENKLRKIERGEFSAKQFIDELKVMVNEIVLTVLRDNSGTNIIVEQDTPKSPTKGGAAESAPKKKRVARVTKFEQVLCPVCGKGHMVKGKSAFGCSEWANGCHTALPFTEYSADLTPAKLRDAIKKNFKTQDK